MIMTLCLTRSPGRFPARIQTQLMESLSLIQLGEEENKDIFKANTTPNLYSRWRLPPPLHPYIKEPKDPTEKEAEPTQPGIKPREAERIQSKSDCKPSRSEKPGRIQLSTKPKQAKTISRSLKPLFEAIYTAKALVIYRSPHLNP